MRAHVPHMDIVQQRGRARERVVCMQKRPTRIILEAQRTSRTVAFDLRWIPFYNEGCILRRRELAYKRINDT